jgi:hypothetical protein
MPKTPKLVLALKFSILIVFLGGIAPDPVVPLRGLL